VALGLVIIGAGLRFWDLDGKSFWGDEVFSVWRASQPAREIWTNPSDPHPPLYYLLLHGVLQFGRTETVVRLPSAVASVASMGLGFVLARRLAGSQVAWLAAALLALSPLDVWYAQEARMYAFVAAAGLLAAVGLTMGLWPGVLVVAAGVTVGLYLDYVMLPLWAGVSAAWLVWRAADVAPRQRLLVWFLGSAIGVLAARPLWVHLHSSLSALLGHSYISASLDEVVGLPAVPGLWYPYLTVAAAVAVGGATLVLERTLTDSQRRPLVSRMLLVTFIAATAAAAVPRWYTLKKLAVTGWPFVVLFAAWVARPAAGRRPHLVAVMLSVGLAASVFNVVAVPKDDWRGLVGYVNGHVAAEEPVWVDPAWQKLPYTYYGARRPLASSQPGASLEQTLRAASVVWLVAHRRFGAPIPGSPSEAWLDEHAQLTERVKFSRLELRRYERPASR
jgi:uncharacterized membrane protein